MTAGVAVGGLVILVAALVDLTWTTMAARSGAGPLALAPLPASSGKTIRHRLNRGGGRQANTALYRVLITRMSHHQPTRDYVARRLGWPRARAWVR